MMASSIVEPLAPHGQIDEDLVNSGRLLISIRKSDVKTQT